MAIQKSKTLANGASGDYWKVIQVAADKVNLTLIAHIALFTSADFKFIDHLGLVKQFRFSCTKEQLNGDTTALAYTLITAKVESTRSVDINGSPLDPPVAYDPDIAGGTPV